jgi:hypothetical protein
VKRLAVVRQDDVAVNGVELHLERLPLRPQAIVVRPPDVEPIDRTPLTTPSPPARPPER